MQRYTDRAFSRANPPTIVDLVRDGLVEGASTELVNAVISRLCHTGQFERSGDGIEICAEPGVVRAYPPDAFAAVYRALCRACDQAGFNKRWLACVVRSSLRSGGGTGMPYESRSHELSRRIADARASLDRRSWEVDDDLTRLSADERSPAEIIARSALRFQEIFIAKWQRELDAMNDQITERKMPDVSDAARAWAENRARAARETAQRARAHRRDRARERVLDAFSRWKERDGVTWSQVLALRIRAVAALAKRLNVQVVLPFGLVANHAQWMLDEAAAAIPGWRRKIALHLEEMYRLAKAAGHNEMSIVDDAARQPDPNPPRDSMRYFRGAWNSVVPCLAADVAQALDVMKNDAPARSEEAPRADEGADSQQEDGQQAGEPASPTASAADLNSLPPAWRSALALYEYAFATYEDVVTDEDAYYRLQDAVDLPGEATLPESVETWKQYLSRGRSRLGVLKVPRRGPPGSNRNVVDRRDLGMPHGN